MKERPILFSGPMVRALLDGSKTQTRRVVHNPHRNDGGWVVQDCGKGWWPYRSHDGESGCYLDRQKDGDYYSEAPLRCPYGQPGDRLWVRETWGLHAYADESDWLKGGCTALDLEDSVIAYRADWGTMQDSCHWRPSIHMPRAASRITLEVTGVRVERLEDISEADAIAEGIELQPEPVIAGGWSGENRFTLKGMGTGACAGDVSWTAPTAAELYQRLWESINGPGSWEANPWVWVIEFKRVEGDAA